MSLTLSRKDKAMSDIGRKPDYVVRIRQDESEYWFTAGAAWKMKEKDGLAVRLTQIPTGGWDGSFILVPPLEKEEPAPEVKPKGKR